MDDLERTLSELALAMQGHREALAGRETAASGPSARAVPADSRTALLARLLGHVEAHAGLRVDEAVQDKLRAALSSVGPVELSNWIIGLEALDRDHPHWLTLLENLTTNETYLFRDWPQLELLRSKGLDPLIADGAQRSRPALRIWSAGCASGEEVYSLAILALEALVAAGVATETLHEIRLKSPWSLEVLGTDISPIMLVQARNRVYGTGSLSAFRVAPRPSLRFFPRADGEAANRSRQVRQDILQHVRFEQSNLMRARPQVGTFDVVACRNVLVYFAPQSRKAAQAHVEAAVRPGGFLLLGPTDTPPDSRRFETIWGERAVIYRKRP
ncbi:protein-glutamate O-methyltransferase [soil metagenome]